MSGAHSSKTPAGQPWACPGHDEEGTRCPYHPGGERPQSPAPLRGRLEFSCSIRWLSDMAAVARRAGDKLGHDVLAEGQGVRDQ
jgi:hypothetical protein